MGIYTEWFTVSLFEHHSELVGTSFLMLPDLSTPDQLAWGFNLLPIIMFLITFSDAFGRFNGNKSGFYRYLLISTVIVALVYNVPSALLIFWIGNNLVSFFIFRIRS